MIVLWPLLCELLILRKIIVWIKRNFYLNLGKNSVGVQMVSGLAVTADMWASGLATHSWSETLSHLFINNFQ